MRTDNAAGLYSRTEPQDHKGLVTECHIRTGKGWRELPSVGTPESPVSLGKNLYPYQIMAMKTIEQRKALEELDRELTALQTDDPKRRDIINNTVCAIRGNLEWITHSPEVGPDDFQELEFVITLARDRLKFLNDNPDFRGDVLDLRIAMEEQPPKTLRSL